MQQNAKYRQIKAISNSMMSLYEESIYDFVNLWVRNIQPPQKNDVSLRMGSAIDVLLTKPEEFKEKFIIFPGTAPTAQMLQFCTALANNYKEGKKVEEFYQAAYDSVGFKRDSITKVVEKFAPFKPYFDFLINSKGKTVLSKEEALKANSIVEQLMEGEFTKSVVNARTGGSLEVYDQLEILSKYRVELEGDDVYIPIKGALDRVIIDHERKVIIPCDFKSSFSVGSFENSYFKWNYYRQGSLYTQLVRDWANDKGLEDYEIKRFLFIVCSTTGGKHYMYQMSSVDIEAARVGGRLYTGQYVKGWTEILKEIAYMDVKGNWSYPYEALINDGIIPLNIFDNEHN